MDLTKNWEMLMEPELRIMLRDYGYRMVLRKAIPGRKCSCMIPAADSPDPTCSKCLGTGSLYTDHLILGRKYTPRPNIGKEIPSPIGGVSAHSPMFFIEAIVRPNTNDIMIELVLNPTTDEPLRTYQESFQIRVAYKITHVDEMRDVRGEKMYFQIRADERIWGRD